jgi:hypothetical protein
MLHLLLSLLCVAVATGVRAVEPSFSPKISIKNESKRILFFQVTLMKGAQLFCHIEPQNINTDLDVVPRTLYFVPVEQGFDPAQAALLFDAKASKPNPLDLPKTEPWCIIDNTKQTSDTCWSRSAYDASKGRVSELYMISSCTNPLVTQALIEQAQREQKDIVVTIRDGQWQVFVGTVELVTRRGFFGSVYYNIQQFFRSLFGRSKS